MTPQETARYDQALAAVKQAHGAGRSEEWYDALARRLLWYRDHDGDMSACPVSMP